MRKDVRETDLAPPGSLLDLDQSMHERRSRCRPVSSKFSGDSHFSNLPFRDAHSQSSIAYHAVSRLRPFWIMCWRNMPSNEKPSRSAARRDGSLSALHFHS
jgi:hypothetical protein